MLANYAQFLLDQLLARHLPALALEAAARCLEELPASRQAAVRPLLEDLARRRDRLREEEAAEDAALLRRGRPPTPISPASLRQQIASLFVRNLLAGLPPVPLLLPAPAIPCDP